MNFFIRVVSPILLIIYISIETILKLQNSSLCSSTGCKLAGELLKFNSIYLNIFGIIGALAIAITGFKSIKNPVWEKLFFVTLYSAIIFETIMISFQIFVNPEPCKFCLGVFTTLISIGIFADYKKFIYFLPIVLSVFSALSMLNIPKNEHLVTKDGIYLIHSEKCPHCKNVKEYFKENNISFTGINSASTTVKFFANSLGIKQIPISLIKDGREIKIVYGDKPIIKYFESKKNSENKSVENGEEGTPEKIDLFQSQEDGCGLSLTGTADCDKK